ncbi:MAG: extracellular solute-binding protein [Candidatus Pristimantibacillus lignocellulolyticus]|uniref:Extracellular solute-binding protein n=1 Tax=Candidatus Pristimantibacillus lignocellulolyticus TaxID=2994561 RepID=A0A9J6Z8W7_9BACL|nr:MAG: extracellular solute-binding protein [Candidatus Pristimantibacillus lignocellulolyticus]
MVRFLRKYTGTILIVVVLTLVALWWANNRSFDQNVMNDVTRHTEINEETLLEDENSSNLLEQSYYKYYYSYVGQGFSDVPDEHITIPSIEYSSISAEGTSIEQNLDGQFGSVIALQDEKSWVEYEVTILTDGFYQIGMDYYALEGKRSGLVRSIQVDGGYPFYQAKQVEFQRMWQEYGEPWYDNQDNEYNPKREEVFGWQYRDFIDAEAKVAEGFRFFLSKGTHTIRIEAIREPGAIGQLHIYAPKAVSNYAEVSETYANNGYKETTGFNLKFQAELSTLRSDPTLKRIEDREPDTEPFSSSSKILNSFGGLSWRDGGQWAEWEIEVPESGLYNIGARFGQWFLNGFPVQRKIYINGELPFKEMNSVPFPYKQEWQISNLSQSNEEDYLFYLEKGTNTIRMEVQVGELGEVLELVSDTSQKMSLLTREVIRVTGTNPDPNADWKLERNIPNIIERLETMAWNIDDAITLLTLFGVEEGSSELSTLYEARGVLVDMSKDTRSIPARLLQFRELQSALGLWVNNLSKQSLLLDYLIVKSPDQAWPRPAAPIIVRVGTSISDLALTFTNNYGGVGTVYDADEEVLDVWIARGRDWADIIKQMIDEDFTPESGIKVNVNVIPANQMQLLMLANTSGLAPDVALGVEGEVPIDFAVRNALVDLGSFDDYEEVAARFRPGALIPYKYDGGNFALPENQNFFMLFYRKDIMAELGYSEDEMPETWDDVMELIPILQQNGMDFFYPHAINDTKQAINEFAPFLFQNGGDFYTENGSKSALDSPEALKAMKLWTGLFTNYKIEKQADFYNRFRSGEMPIGVADYSTYILLSTAAPELTGWWGMKPMPGIKQENGEINRSTGGLAQTGIIFKSSDRQTEAWEFLKWWTSADAQERFGSELEALLGVEARWNTANVEALQRLPWQAQDIEAILEQWEWFREREVVLGGYYTTRYIANMWNEIVLSGRIVRESVEDGVKEIDKELSKKREEFGLDLAGEGGTTE